MADEQQTWRPMAYGSGTTNVLNMDDPHSPWVYCVVVRPVTDDDRQRYAMCEDIAVFLNGGPRPAWLDDMERVSEGKLVGVDGSEVEACGPMYDADPPNLFWQTRMDDEAVDARARLIDRLWRKDGTP